MRKNTTVAPIAYSLLLLGCNQPARTAAQNPPQDPRESTVAPASTPKDASAPRALQPSDFNHIAWRSIGPANMAGRVSDIALAPGNPDTFFVAFATGGLFKTTNGGTTFSAVFDKQETLCIGSVVVADAPPDWPGWSSEQSNKDNAESPGDDEPKDKGKAKIIWVGTGEGNGRNSSSWGNGVYRSTDGGSSFTHVGLSDTHEIPALAVDPRNPDVCYVAAMGHLWGPNQSRGLYKTQDGGKTWNPVLQINENVGCCDVLVNPRNPEIVYAAFYQRRRTAHSFQSGGPDGGIYRSRDGGETWTKLTEGLPPQTGRIGLDLFAADPAILYAVVESDFGGSGTGIFDNYSKSGGLFKSQDGGDTWTRVSELSPRPFYFSKVRVDPKNDRRIYMLGWRLYVSDDGGRNFRAGGARKPHVDMHALRIDAENPDNLFMGTDGGLYLSKDKGKTWDFLNHLPVGQFYNVAVDNSDPYRVGGGLQDNGSWIGPSSTIFDSGKFMGTENVGITNQDWRFIHGGDGFHVVFDPENPNIVYAESQGGFVARIHLDTGFRKMINPAPKEGQPRFRFNWNAPLIVSPHDPTVLYLGGNRVFKLTRRGDRWHAISDDLSRRDPETILTVGSDAETYGTVVALAESPLKKGMIYAGTDDGRIHVTRDDGRSWTDVTPADFSTLYVSKIEPSHHEPDTAYVAVDGHRSDDYDPHVLLTTDSGGSWRDITANLPPHWSARVVREDRRNPNVLYVGTENALYISINRGETWTRLNSRSLPPASVHDMIQHPRELDLVVATHGRSIYIYDDASCLGALTPEIINKPFHLFTPRSARPRHTLPYGGLWSDRMFTAKNAPAGAIFNYWIRDYSDAEVKINITDPHGNTVRSLKGQARPGLNRVTWDLQFEQYDRVPRQDVIGGKHFVPPGQYKVNASFGDQTAHAAITIRPTLK